MTKVDSMGELIHSQEDPWITKRISQNQKILDFQHANILFNIFSHD